MDFDAGRPQVVVAAFGDNRHRQRRSRIRRQGQPREMQLAGGDQRGHAAVHIVGDPRERVLCRRIFADGWMRMGIDQSRNRRDAVGVKGVVSGLGQTIADGLNNTVFDEDRIRLSERALQLSRNKSADVFDQDRRHARTIAKGP